MKSVGKALCSACKHPIALHVQHSHAEGLRYGSTHFCDERMSDENNDTCGCTNCSPVSSLVTNTFYAVADSSDLTSAKWYRTYSSTRSSGWVKDLDDAKVWSRRSAAKAKATALGPSARLVEFVVSKVNIISNEEHAKEVADARAREEKRRAEQVRRSMIELAEHELRSAQEKLRKLRGPCTCGSCKSCMGM